MSDTLTGNEAVLGISAGAMLREARERHGMHIAMLAAMMKITPAKLEALEADRYHELPDLAFVRALARTVCRTLKVDPDPVLAKLPRIAKPEGLVHTAVGLNTPFREGGGRHLDPQRWSWLRRPVFWATFLVLAGAALLAVAPPSWLQKLTGRLPASAPGSATVSTPVGKPSAVVTEVLPGATGSAVPVVAPVPAPVTPPTVVSVPVVTAPPGPLVRPDFMGPPRSETAAPVIETVHAAPANADTVAAPAAGVLVIRAKAEGWVEVRDARGRALIARTFAAGETVGIDGTTPFKLRLGNAPQTDVRFRGEAVDLAARTKGVAARFELK